jgi:hypothetical protein
MGLGVFVALVTNGVGVGAALTSVYGAVGAFVIRFTASATLSSLAARAQAREPQQQDLKRDLQFPTSRPAKRFVVGEVRMPATVLPYPVVGGYAYAAWLVNSRPSDGGFTVFFDGREVESSGDPYDFTVDGGASATNAPFLDHVKIWIGRGDQTQPPQTFLDEAGWVEGGDDLLWRPSDIGAGLTIVYARLSAGANSSRNSRWPNPVPQMELEGRFSRVWDPRDLAQDPDDADTWTWSEDPFLCGLDVLRTNPFRPYELRNLELDMWQAAADVADEVMPLTSGGSERRYSVAGVVTFDGKELDALVKPLLAAGAGRLVRAGGRLGVIPGAPRTPAVTISDALEGLTFSTLRPDSELMTELRVNYSPRERGGEPGELRPWQIPGALAADGGQPSVATLDLSMVPSETQGQRIRNITGRKNRHQKKVSVVAWPTAMKAVSGSVVQLDLPAPYGAHVNGLYEVESMHPMLDPVGKEGYALRCPVVLSEYSDDIFAWTPATDEEPVVHPPYDGTRDGVAPPGPLSVTTGAGVDLDTGSGLVSRFRFEFAPSTSASVEHYEWQWRVSGESYQAGGTLDGETLDAEGDVFGFLPASSANALHDIRVRTWTGSGASDWVEITGVSVGFGVTVNSATAGTGQAVFNVTAANTVIFKGVRIYRATTTDFANAVEVLGLTTVATGATMDVTATGLSVGSGEFWVVPVTQTNAEGASVGPHSLIIL